MFLHGGDGFSAFSACHTGWRGTRQQTLGNQFVRQLHTCRVNDTMTSSSHLKWKSASKGKMFRHDIFVSHSHYTKINSFLSFFLTFKKPPCVKSFIYIHNIQQVLLYSNVPCTVGWPGTRGCTVQWSGQVWQGLLYRRVAVFDRTYCTVEWPLMTGFTV